MSADRAAWFLWVEGSPSAAENPPHDRLWRAAVAEVTAGQPTPVEVELDFLLKRRRLRIDLDNLVRLALDGLRDAGVLSPGLTALDTIFVTKREAPPLGLGVTLVRSKGSEAPRPLHESVDLVVESDVMPREGNYDEKHAWRKTIRGAWSGAIGEGPVALDIAARTSGSLGTMLKPVIDGLETYLGRSTGGRGEFQPLDDRIVMLLARREPELPVALRVTAGVPRESLDVRIPPPIPALPAMDPDYLYSTSDLESIARHTAWLRIFAEPPGWGAI